MWEISNLGQSTAFLWAMMLGGGLSVVYDLFRLDRLIFKRSVLSVALADILFFIISSISVFCLLLITTNGQIRAFILGGVLLGFLFFRLTLSKLMDWLLKPIKKAVNFIRKKYNLFIEKIAGFDMVFLKKSSVFKKWLKNLKKANKNSKKTEKNS